MGGTSFVTSGIMCDRAFGFYKPGAFVVHGGAGRMTAATNEREGI